MINRISTDSVYTTIHEFAIEYRTMEERGAQVFTAGKEIESIDINKGW